MKPLEEIRVQSGYNTQKMLSTIMGVEEATISRWENGQRFPQPEMLLRLSDVLGVTEREIIQAITQAKESA